MSAAPPPQTPATAAKPPSAILVYLLGVYLLVKSAALAVIGIWIAQPVHAGSCRHARRPRSGSTPSSPPSAYVHLDPHGGHFLGKLLDTPRRHLETSGLEAIRNWGCWFYAVLHIVEGIRPSIERWALGEADGGGRHHRCRIHRELQRLAIMPSWEGLERHHRHQRGHRALLRVHRPAHPCRKGAPPAPVPAPAHRLEEPP